MSTPGSTRRSWRCPTARSARRRWSGPATSASPTPTSGFERIRYQYLARPRRRARGRQDDEDLGFAVRVIHDGAWGFASGVALTERRGRRVAETAGHGGPGRRRDDHPPVELAPEPVHEDVTWVSAVRRQPARRCPLAEKTGLLAGWTARLLAARRRRARDRAASSRSRRTSTTPTWPAPRPPSSGSGCTPTSRCTGTDARDRGLRLDAHDRAAGRPRLGVPHRRRTTTGTPSSRSSPSCSPRSSPRRASRPATTTW